MGLNQYKDIYNISCDKDAFLHKKEYCDIKPAFSIKNGYFFKVTDIEDYQLSFYGSSVRLNTKQTVGQFYLEFDRLYYFGDKEDSKIRFCEYKEIEKYSTKESLKEELKVGRVLKPESFATSSIFICGSFRIRSEA